MMSPTRIAVICVVVAAVPLAGLTAIRFFADDAAPSAASASRSAAGATVEDSRTQFLIALSRHYVLQEAALVTPAMRSGAELAPVPFLNKALEHSGAKWRVRTTVGIEADTYDVS